MKNKVLKFYITMVCLFSNELIFANPGDTSENDDLEIVDAPPLSINDYIWVLVLVVLVYALWQYKAVPKAGV